MKTQSSLLIAFAGPNGAGKSSLRNLLFRTSPIPFVNADIIAAETGLSAYEAAEVAETERQRLFKAGLSFMMETVLSDPVGAKVAFLHEARAAGYFVIVHFVGLDSAARSGARVATRVAEGGHDVPPEKIAERYQRVLENLRRLLGTVDVLTIYDNSSSAEPYRTLARFEGETLVELTPDLPAWIAFLDLPARRTPETRPLP